MLLFARTLIARKSPHTVRCPYVVALPALEPMREDARPAARWLPKGELEGQVRSSVAAAVEGVNVACLDDEERLAVGHSQVFHELFVHESFSHSYNIM